MADGDRGRVARPAHAEGAGDGRDRRRRRRRSQPTASQPTPNVIVLESGSDRQALLRPSRQPRRGLRRRHQGARHRPRQRRAPLPRADPARRQRVSDRARRRRSTSSGPSPSCFTGRAPIRSAAPSRSSAPRAASAPRPSRTTSPGRSRASSATATVIVDLDIAFGTAGLDFNQDPPQGVAEAVFAPDRLDGNLVDRLLSKCGDNLSLLAAPAMLDRTIDLTETALDQLLDILRSVDAEHRPRHAACLDRLGAAHAHQCRRGRDRRGAGARVAAQRQEPYRRAAAGRPNDRKPQVVLNLTGMPKRPEIAAAEFVEGARDRARPPSSRSTRSSSERPPTTAR